MFSLVNWYPSICVGLLMIFFSITYDKFLYNILYKVTDYTDTEYDDYLLEAFKRPLYWLLFILAFYWGIELAPVKFVDDYSLFFLKVLRSVIIICISWALIRFFSKSNGFLEKFFTDIGFSYAEIGVNICSPVLRFMMVMVALVLVGKEWDYDISVFFASLSLGSLAVAFAAKDTLANVFGSIVLILDKPLSIGDWVLVNGIEGTVESISFRSTSIRKFSQALVYIPNSVLTNTPIVNFSKMEKRRLDFEFKVDYINSANKIEAMQEDLREWLSNQSFSLGSASVNFVAFGDFACRLRVICYVSVVDYYEWLKLRNDVNLVILKIAEKHNIKIAVPVKREWKETIGG